MNPKNLVRLSNIIGVASLVLLIYWVFSFISIEVFGLKVFRENITETFFLSIFGILALMFGALMINVMFNLTRIAEKHNQDEYPHTKRRSKWIVWFFVLSFPLLFAVFYFGDQLTAIKKKKLLIDTAQSIVKEHQNGLQGVADYMFTRQWINTAEAFLTILSRTDSRFPNTSIIVLDRMDSSDVLLAFEPGWETNDTIKPLKRNYLLRTTKEERDYLIGVLNGTLKDVRFSAHDGRYELYYPYISGKKRIVFYFSSYQRYGKIGS